MAQKTRTAAGDGLMPAWAWGGAGILGLGAYLLGLTLPLVGPDEPRYAQVAREMYERNDWITPTLGGINWFEKPALLYWLDICSYHVLGVSEFAARIGPALFGVATVASLWVLGRIVSGHAAFANWLGLIAGSTLGILVFSHGGSFDIIVTFPLTGALVSIFVFAERERLNASGQLPALALFYGFIGIGLLAKGLIGIVFPFATATLFFGLSGRIPGRRFWLSLLWGLPLLVVIAATWYVPMYMRHGREFIDQFIIQHHFERFLSNKYQHPQPFYFFFWVLPLMTLPWLPFVLAECWRSAKRLFGRNISEDVGPETNRLVLFSVCWVAVPLVFFSFSGSKLPGYILPAVPGAVILGTVFIHRLVEQSSRWRIIAFSLSCLVFIGSIIAIEMIAPRIASAESVRSLFATAETRGFGNARVFSLHTISHNAEFYAAGRLLRAPDGQQKKLYSPNEVVSEMERAGVQKALVLVPTSQAAQLTDSGLMRSDLVGTNGELKLFAVERP